MKTNHPPASRCGEHNENQPSPLRAVAVRTMLLSSVVLAAAARRGWRVQVRRSPRGVGSRSASACRSKASPVPTAGGLILTNQDPADRKRCALDVGWTLGGLMGKACCSPLHCFRARFWGLRRSNLRSALEWAGQGRCPCIPAGRCPENLQGGLSPLTPFCLRRGGVRAGALPLHPRRALP